MGDELAVRGCFWCCGMGWLVDFLVDCGSEGVFLESEESDQYCDDSISVYLCSIIESMCIVCIRVEIRPGSCKMLFMYTYKSIFIHI